MMFWRQNKKYCLIFVNLFLLVTIISPVIATHSIDGLRILEEDPEPRAVQCGDLTEQTFEGKNVKSITSLFGGNTEEEGVASARKIYPHGIPSGTKTLHFFVQLSFSSMSSAELVFEVIPVIPRFACHVNVIQKKENDSYIILDPKTCLPFMEDPLLRSDYERQGGQFQIPCLEDEAGGKSLSFRNMCPNIPVLEAVGSSNNDSLAMEIHAIKNILSDEIDSLKNALAEEKQEINEEEILALKKGPREWCIWKKKVQTGWSTSRRSIDETEEILQAEVSSDEGLPH